jgi:hypothetical protein
MKVQILLDGNVINTQIVSDLLQATKPTIQDYKRLALKAALEDKSIRVSESLRVTFKLFDVMGEPIDQ